MGLFRQTTSYALRRVAERFDLDQDELEAAYKAAYSALGPETQEPFPYVRDVCSFICESGGQNFIVTHRARESVEGLLQAHDLIDYFTDWIVKEDPYPRKPDPTSLLAMVRRHSLEADRCMAIGDREIDVLAGKRAGLMTCMLSGDGSSSQADLTVTGFDQLLQWLQAQVATYRAQNTGGTT
jgi:HAD superfamily hydrolase (TIGR01549 family)